MAYMTLAVPAILQPPRTAQGSSAEQITPIKPQLLCGAVCCADARRWCPVPGGGADVLLFGALTVFVGCALYSRLSAVWALAAGVYIPMYTLVSIAA